MPDQRGSTHPGTPASMAGPSPPPTTTSISPSSGSDGQSTKAVRKGDIKVDPKLGANSYLTWAEEMWIQLKSMRVLTIVESKSTQTDPTT